MTERTILHIDMNSFFASVECLYNPSIRHLPVAVAGDAAQRHGIILAKNEIAKQMGVKTGEVLWQARQKCSNLVLVPPRYDLYLQFSRMAREIYADYTDRIEPYGIDEAWIDVTASGRFGTGEQIAEEIRQRVRKELGVTVSVGVSFNKVFAKLGSDYKKPDAVTVFSKENFRETVWRLPVGDLLFVGRATERKLRGHGITTIGKLAALDPGLLHDWFGKWGDVLYLFANGEDTSPVMKVGETAVIKSIGNAATTPRDLTNEQEVNIMFHILADSVAERMRGNGFYTRTVQIYLRDNRLYSFERQTRLKNPTCLASEIHDAAMQLFCSNYSFAGRNPLRTVGIRATDFVPDEGMYQLNLFDDPEVRRKKQNVECTVAEIRKKFGRFAIGRGVTLTDRALWGIVPRDDARVYYS